MTTAAPVAPITTFGVMWWNQRSMAAMAGRPLAFTQDAAQAIRAAEAGRDVMTWASREPPGLAEAALRGGGSFIRVEDGFLRSPGLGAHFSPAYSLIFDSVGVYYDATRSSGLERLLAERDFDAALLARAEALCERLTRGAVSKYAVGRGRPPTSPRGRDRVLVIGQVEDDASIRLGGADVRTNLALLERARAAHPGAWVAYKPHPDVLRAGRPGRVAVPDALRHADAIWPDVTIAAALEWAEAVHTISSLAGFEALQRGRDVHVHGRPFYAGWGLTLDHAPQPERRGRALALESLIAATLILYPRYLDPFTSKRIEVEALLAHLEGGWRDPLVGRPLWHRAAATAKRWLGPLRGRL